ncbi:kinase-like domain-containing protein [Phycomyces nitens]|nr:kinase-like domain-containing protein [Phycomyces nitens]
MSFLGKFLDKARHSTHTGSKDKANPKPSPYSTKEIPEFGAPSPPTTSIQHEPEYTPDNTGGLVQEHYASGYVTPRPSVEMNTSNQQQPMEIYQPQATPLKTEYELKEQDQGVHKREALKQKYQLYDKQVIDQRRDKPKLKLDDFHLLRTLGTGSFGRVHLAQSRHNGRFYAIKVLRKTEVVRLKQVEHTNNEKHILETVANPFLVNLWGTFQDDECLYMVMDYVPGGELFSVLRKSKRFPDHVAKFYAAEVVLAIEYLHSKDIAYRDLKPENLLLDNTGHIKITDFGFAKHVSDITWTLCGTPDYLAPEVIQSKGYSKSVDWWSLGVLIFEMLAGYPPFYDDDHLKLYEKIIQGKIHWPSYLDPHAKDLLKRLLTSDLSRRYGNLRNGAEDIKNHAWFSGVEFERVANRQVRAPYIPSIRGDGDASHFDKYPENTEKYGVSAPDPYRDMFPDF